MLDRGASSDSTTHSAEVGNGHADNAAVSLEPRVRRLEDAVAQLQDTEQLEERVATRVTERVSRNLAVPVAEPAEQAGFFGRLPRAFLPMAVTTITPPHAEQRAATNGPGHPRPWAFLDVFMELRTIWRMYVDPRYRLTWTGRVVPAVLFAAILTSWLWLPFALALATVSSTLATIFVKLADLVLAFFLYKVLSREARRYRDCFPDNPPRIP